MVQEVECLDAELQVEPIMDRECAMRRHVSLHRIEGPGRVTRHIALNVGRRSLKCRVIDDSFPWVLAAAQIKGLVFSKVRLIEVVRTGTWIDNGRAFDIYGEG